MSRTVSGTLGRYWHREVDGRLACELCPRNCRLKPGQQGFCGIRIAADDGIHLVAYGKASGFAVDPIEKKPLYHFHPGSRVLSFGTIGCNLGCKFCQNWSISKSRDRDKLGVDAAPGQIAEAAKGEGCQGVAFTYNDPVISAEYTMDTARACRRLGLFTVAVTAGYINPKAREEFFAEIDAANVDLKGFSEDFYRRWTLANLAPVLDTLKYLAKSKVWLEVTTLLIPGANDEPAELRELTRWIAGELGPHTPLHFSAFHPDYQVHDREGTSVESLLRSAEIARESGLQYVYLGNIHGSREAARAAETRCPHCDRALVRRAGYQAIQTETLFCAGGPGEIGRCSGCSEPIAGVWNPVALSRTVEGAGRES